MASAVVAAPVGALVGAASTLGLIAAETGLDVPDTIQGQLVALGAVAAAVVGCMKWIEARDKRITAPKDAQIEAAEKRADDAVEKAHQAELEAKDRTIDQLSEKLKTADQTNQELMSKIAGSTLEVTVTDTANTKEKP